MKANMRFCILGGAVALVLGAVPASAQETTSILTVYGQAFMPDGVTPAPAGLRVEIENLTTAKTVGGALEGPGQYAVTFVDYMGNRAAAVGDALKITVFDGEMAVCWTPPFEVAEAAIADRRMRRDVIYPGRIEGTVRTCSSGVPLEGADIVLSGDASQLVATGMDGSYRLQGLSGGLTYTVTPTGGPGATPLSIRGYDAALCGRVANHLPIPPGSPTSPTPCEMRACDVTENGVVEWEDAENIARYAVGLPMPSGQAGEWSFDPPSRVYVDLGQAWAEQDYSAVLLGDVDFTMEASLEEDSPLPERPGVVWAEVSGDGMKVGFECPRERAAISVDISLSYNPRYIEFGNLHVDQQLRDFKAASNGANAGTYAACWYRADPVELRGRIVTLAFRILGSGNPRLRVNGYYVNNRLLFSGPVPIAGPPTKTGETLSVGSLPNPFNPETLVQYTLPAGEARQTTLEIYNLQGQLVRRLVSEMQEEGVHQVPWNGTDDYGRPAPSGLYFCRLESGGLVDTEKLVLLK